MDGAGVLFLMVRLYLIMNHRFLMKDGFSFQKRIIQSPSLFVLVSSSLLTIITIDIVFFVVVFFFLVVAATTTFLVPKPKSSLSARSLPGSSGKERTLDCIVEAALAFDGWWLF